MNNRKAYVVHVYHIGKDGKGYSIPTKRQSTSLTKAMDIADEMAQGMPSNISLVIYSMAWGGEAITYVVSGKQ